MFSAYAYPPQLPRFPSRGPTTPHSGPNLQVLLHESPRRSSTVQMAPTCLCSSRHLNHPFSLPYPASSCTALKSPSGIPSLARQN